MLVETIRKIILKELSLKTYRKVIENMPDQPLPFDGELFGGSNNKRIVIPFVSELSKDIKDELEKLNYQIDIEKGQAVKNIKTERGEKQVATRIGKALNKEVDIAKKILQPFFKYFKEEDAKSLDLTDYTEEEKKHLRSTPHFSFIDPKLNRKAGWGAYTLEDLSDGDLLLNIAKDTPELLQLIRNPNIKENIDRLYRLTKLISSYNKEGAGMSIVVSRAPIDVIRMSDFQNIQSCHSEGGQYWECAIQETKDGGAVAFLVKNDDLKKVNLEDEEIFEDEDRNISGIKPLSRIRLRRYEHQKKGYTLAVPEVRVYGQNIDGFLDTLTDWSAKKQEKYVKNLKPDELKDFILVGGSYRDNQASRLFNNLLNTRDFYGDTDVRSDGEENYEALADQYEEEARDMLNDFNRHVRHVSAWFEVDVGDDAPYVNYSGELFINLENIELSKLFDWRDSSKLRRDLQDFGFYFEDVEIQDYGDNFGLRCSLSAGNHSSDPDGFNDFLSDLKDVDNKYAEIFHAVINWLKDNGYLHQDTFPLTQILNAEFDHFDDNEFDEDTISIDLNVYTINFPHGFAITTFSKELIDIVQEKVIEKIKNIINAPSLKQLFLPGLESMESGVEPPISTNGFSLNIQTQRYVAINDVYYNHRLSVYGKFQFNLAKDRFSKEEVELIYNFMKYLDRNYDSLMQMIEEIFFAVASKQKLIKKLPDV